MAGRISVVVAGDVYANPSLVRPFLEDDGYRIDAEVFDGAELLPAVSGAMPDAVVVDEHLLADRPHVLEDIRLVTPETKVLVIGAAPGGNGATEPDAYLEPGVSLATMSVEIGRLVGNGHLGPSGHPAGGERAPGGLIRFIASVGLPVVAVWTLIVAVTPRGVTPPAADTTDLAQTVIFTPQGTDRLDEAYTALDRLIVAVESGNPVMATIWARTLMDAREGAVATGFVIVDLDHAITSRLVAVAALLSPSAIAELEGILGALFPALPDEQTPGGGSGLILGPTVGSGGGLGLPGLGGLGGTDGGSSGSGPDVISGPIGGGDVITGLAAGDGMLWGQSHKAEHAAKKDSGDRPSTASSGDHGPPPWAGTDDDAGSHDQKSGHGQAKGHSKDQPTGQGHGNGHGRGNGNGHGARTG